MRGGLTERPPLRLTSRMSFGRGLLLAIAVGCACAFAPIASGRTVAPGAASTAAFTYTDPEYRGWPVAPVDEEHPVRAGFVDPRYGGYHAGVDVTVRDNQPEDGAPAGRTHRVYAVDGGVASYDPTATAERSCAARVVSVGHFSYGHVDPVGVVEAGQFVTPRQQIGWTCAGQWHVHVTEWQVVRGQLVRVNPLRPGGKLWPYSDGAAPVIHEIRFFELPQWSLDLLMPWADDGAVAATSDVLQGVVDMRASISDPQSLGNAGAVNSTLMRLRNAIAPYRLHLEVRRLGARRDLIDRDVFRGDVALTLDRGRHGGALLFGSLYAPGTSPALGAEACLATADGAGCQGTYSYRLFATSTSRYWDTRFYRNGRYRVDITAWDAWGNATSKTVVVRVANG